MGIAEDIIIVLILGLVAGFLSYKLRFPMFLGYIVIGVIVGPYIGKFTISNPEDLKLLSEIGVALLLFSIGLELSFNEFKEIKFISIFGTILQVAITLLFGYWIGILYGLSFFHALLFGMIISLSSTVIVLKLLEDRNIIKTISGKIMIGILIIQDIIAIPMMILVSRMHQFSTNYFIILLTFVEIIIFVIITIFLSRRIIPFIFKIIAKANSQELFLLSVASFGLGIGYLTYMMKLSFIFGTFVAGMMLNRTDYHHRALSNIIPLRDIFGLMFFVSIGMLLNPYYLFSNFLFIITVVLIVIIVKFFIFFIICRIFGYKDVVPIVVSFGLSQVGEFAFIISTLALNNNLINDQFYSTLISVTVLTMFLSPFVFMLSSVVYNFFIRDDKPILHNISDINNSEKHVIIVGSGRVGNNVASILYQLNIPFVMIERNYRKFEFTKKKNYISIYGNACLNSIINAAGLENAILLVSTITSVNDSKELIKTVRRIKEDISIIARAEGLEQMRELVNLNIYELVQPEFEASIEIIRKIMLLLKIPITSVQQYTDNIRHQKYSSIYRDVDYRIQSRDISDVSSILQLHWLEINDDSIISGKSVDTIIEEKGAIENIFVVGVFRSGIFYPGSGKEFELKNGDLLALIGNFSSVIDFEKHFIKQ